MTTATATDTQTTHAAAMLVAGDARLAAGDATAERLVHNLAACGGKPNMSAKPRVTPLGCDTYRVIYGHGGCAEISKVSECDWRGAYWSVSSEPSGARGRNTAHEATALAEGSRVSFDADVFAPWGTATDVHALALACNSDRGLFTKTIKRIAKQRFGVKVSARGSTGTGYGWVHVKAATRGDIGAETIVSRLCAHGTIRPCGGERVSVICQLAGHQLPDGFTITPPQWD